MAVELLNVAQEVMDRSASGLPKVLLPAKIKFCSVGDWYLKEIFWKKLISPSAPVSNSLKMSHGK